MKKTLLIYFLLIAQLPGFAQDKKYPSLLWEIKKEGTRASYIYGTMHVSERIAFHLTDVFFEKILSTDKIALESNPETWLDEIQDSPSDLGLFNNAANDYLFYQSFQISPLRNQSLKQSFLFNDMMVNGILYRTQKSSTNYQEDTYLDMFIYQTGKRTNREIINLEDFKESRALVEKAFWANRNFELPVWVKKLANKEKISTETLNKIASQKEEHWNIYKILKNHNRLDLLPEKINDTTIAQSALLEYSEFDGKNDSTEFLTKKEASYENKKHQIYFFKTKSRNSYTNQDISMIEYVSFELDENNQFLTDPDRIFYFGDNEYIDDEFLDDIYKNEMDRVLFHDKKRVSFIPEFLSEIYSR